MLPVLFKIGPITIHTYGVLAALGFFLAVLWAARSAAKAGLDAAAVWDLCFYLVLAAIIGARLWFVVVHWNHYLRHPLNVLKFWQGGLVFYGGLILAGLTAIIFTHRKNLPLWTTADLLAPGLALGQAVGRLGCLAAGCCYGRPTDLPWAVTFTDKQSLAPLHQPLHPAQLYSSLALFVIFGLLVLLQARKRFAGQVFWTYGLLHGLVRTALETLRGDFRGPNLIGPLTATQVTALSLALLSLVMLIRPGRRLSSGQAVLNDREPPPKTEKAAF